MQAWRGGVARYTDYCYCYDWLSCSSIARPSVLVASHHLLSALAARHSVVCEQRRREEGTRTTHAPPSVLESDD